MPSNIEIKARARNFEDLKSRAEKLSDTPVQMIPQEDTFFITSQGRLKLRVLELAYGIRGVVKKTRYLYLVGQTRIHVDDVEGLGQFMELEVVMGDGQSDAEGQKIAEGLMASLGVERGDLIDGAYMDLLEKSGAG